ncbi:MAG: two-component sensor kinase, probably involved in phosphate sensing [candidate division WWE3 bacterium GW2011_GWF2_41_45]|uniref:histidine kinase n=3 Tax=Katanobacteria TaxID=422282 RepID=A0A1F4VZS9_UNCKA|nr:MAG: two-component sensor kinase, probably involved in phosphate sensing [candidate division WWE3 bacterium GW2011_GWC2_41_23]KKS08756.1 MAG: two-component sensor kinase, probably involved in phosphate sensing [candidate division WWE3 bacterium GW2011_GWF2_41_45]KKS11797.1 MAG: two-component sensor kinase, probably involved in phosphate sensing [candidate division WWE3 bacterium GW2011_GWF1_41_53]KKS19413.1 MAG: two-component sensor kinase, probably involved in phosphate sensing [candidate di
MPTTADVKPQSIAEEIYKRNRELLQERKRAEDLLYNVSEGVFAVDKDFNITIFNHTLENMLSLPESVAVGKKMEEVVVIENEKNERVDLKQYCFLPQQITPILSGLVLKGSSTSYFVNVRFSVIQSEIHADESECLITISDITKEILLDKTKDDFLSLASHELRTPLTIIKSYLWMLLNDQKSPLGDQQKIYAERTAASTETMIAMVNDMLNISRLEQGKLNFNLKAGKIISSIQEGLTGFDLKAKEKNIGFKIDFSTLPLETDAYYDDDKFKECIVNLVGNAIKFTKEGEVKVNVENAGNYIKISIIDTGVGISPEDVPQLFQKFGKGQRSYEKSEITGGSGLGLYIVKIYIEAMGGEVGYSSPGDFKGSVFWITVPKFTQIHA